jgi:hypothetical protein
MALIDLQRSVVELCLCSEPDAERLAELGDARVWRLYRELIRTRLLRELRFAFKRTFAAVGKDAFERAFEHHLRTEPPRTRFFHALAAGFAASAEPFFRADASLPAHVADLLVYEAALRAVADLPDLPGGVLGEFAFDKVPVLSPALRLLELGHAVHRKALAPGAYAKETSYLCVHRAADELKSRTWTLNAVTYDLMRRLQGGDQPVSDAIAALAKQREIAIDQKFIDGLCSVLADFIDKGVILGGR